MMGWAWFFSCWWEKRRCVREVVALRKEKRWLKCSSKEIGNLRRTLDILDLIFGLEGNREKFLRGYYKDIGLMNGI